MKKIDKIKNYEAARVLLITARDMVETAILKIRETGPSGIDCVDPVDKIQDAIHVVVYRQNQLEGKQ